MDDLTPEQRKKAMRAIKSKDTGIETILRKALWHKGFRYRKNDESIIGKPDIVFIKQKVAVFCDSEFWHGYDWEASKHRIATNSDYWLKKIERNIKRDIKVNQTLQNEGWIVLRFWGRRIKKDLEGCLKVIEEAL